MAARHKTLILIFATMLAMGFSADAFARAGGGGSFGSRGGRTFSAPSATATAPRGASALQRSMTSPNAGAFQRGPFGAPGGGFGGGGFSRGLLGGLVGAGLIGMLFGHGFGGGLGGGMSFIGLLLQLALLYFLFKLAVGFFRNRRPAAEASAFDSRSAQGGPAPFGGYGAGGFSGGFGGGFGGAGPRTSPLEIGQADFAAFEQALAAVQKAYSDEDFNALRQMATPEMASYFAEELASSARQGQVNRLSNVTFLQGDLSEAWREEAAEFASVAMRFSLIDVMLDRATGKIVSGDPAAPQEATEIWTFTRRPGGGPGDWKLAAIQQT